MERAPAEERAPAGKRAPAVERAQAKVNLALHVTGRRSDGYHLLDSLVCFAGVADRLAAEPAPGLALTVAGPFAAALAGAEDNIVLRAAALLRPPGRGARLALYKALPVAAGIGGGSADAAAALRLLSRLWRVPLPEPGRILGLGADVPVCLEGRPARMGGIGEALAPVALPPFFLVLVNPGVPLATAAVFAGLARRENPPLPDLPARFAGAGDLAAWLRRTRNDLEPSAAARAPAVARVLEALAGLPGCALARMSGSGATCFGLFANGGEAAAAAVLLRRARPDWWVAHGAAGGAPPD